MQPAPAPPCTEVWNDSHRREDVFAACEKTISDLRCGYLDLYLVHWPLHWRKGTVMCPDDGASMVEQRRKLDP